jgi:hypothetical protein
MDDDQPRRTRAVKKTNHLLVIEEDGKSKIETSTNTVHVTIDRPRRFPRPTDSQTKQKRSFFEMDDQEKIAWIQRSAKIGLYLLIVFHGLVTYMKNR